MTRTPTILAAAAVAALAVSAAPASAGTHPPEPRGSAVQDGTSNTIVFAERSASFTVDGIIAVLIGL